MDRKEKILKITRECDLATIDKEFKQYAAYDRQWWNMVEGDDKLNMDYEKLDITWDQGCNSVVPAFLRMLLLELSNELIAGL